MESTRLPDVEAYRAILTARRGALLFAIAQDLIAAGHPAPTREELMAEMLRRRNSGLLYKKSAIHRGLPVRRFPSGIPRDSGLRILDGLLSNRH